MPNLTIRQKVLLFKIEVTYNTDPVPTGAADAVLVESLLWSNQSLRMVERPAVRPSLGTLQHIFGGRLVQFTCVAEVKGSGAAGTAPEIGPLMRACGLGETVVPATSVAYSPVSQSLESGTAYIYEDGKRIIVTGCRGNVSFSAGAGGKMMANFTMQGHVAAQTDEALPTPTYDSTIPPVFVGATFTIDSFAATIGNLSFDLANVLATPDDVNSADGYGETTITARDVNGSIDPLDELVADEDFIGNFTADAVMALATGTIGGTAGNRWAVDMPAVSYREVTPGDKDGIASLSLPFGAAESTTDDDITILFT
jgi:hypothetical protein